MASFVARRVIGGLGTIFVSSIVVFLVVRMIPGDPLAAAMGSRNFDPEVAESLRRLYGLDRPLATQYISWLGALFEGDFGFSLLSRTSVTGQVLERIPRTLMLMAGGLGVALVIAIPAGILAAYHRGKLIDALATLLTTVLLATPSFFVGLLLVLVFSVGLGWLPAVGYIDPSESVSGFLRSMVLPWATVGFATTSFMTRVLRSSLLDVFGEGYIRTARARGLSGPQVVTRHALRNAAIPTVTVVGLEIGYLIGGAIVVEVLFSYPGMGLMMVDSIVQRDYPVIQASLLLYTIGFVIVNILTDLSYALLDPRVRVR